MKENKKLTGFYIAIAYIIVLLVGIGCALQLMDVFSERIIATIVFIVFAYTVMFAAIELCVLDNRQNIMQNLALALISLIYFVCTIIISFILNIINQFFWIGEIIVLTLGLIAIIWGLIGKHHIESKP
ncbi:MAG: hypothetical protein LUG61_10035 [Lachnospiraceae bacterium]|nr:hypothetical protein [Lachnospiraceae bacterium]